MSSDEASTIALENEPRCTVALPVVEQFKRAAKYCAEREAYNVNLIRLGL
jgi:hypothetical protein